MRRTTTLALVAVLALTGAACGDDDDSSDDEVEATDDGGGDGGPTDDGGDDGGGTDGDDLAAAIGGMGGCSGAATAVSASIAAGFNPQAAEQLEENEALFDEFASSVPDDIKDDVELFTAYVAAYTDAVAEFEPEDYSDPEVSAQIGEAFEELEEEYPSDEMQTASDRIQAWFTEECPALVGEG